jgi:hypothetical protein
MKEDGNLLTAITCCKTAIEFLGQDLIHTSISSLHRETYYRVWPTIGVQVTSTPYCATVSRNANCAFSQLDVRKYFREVDLAVPHHRRCCIQWPSLGLGDIEEFQGARDCQRGS